MYISIKENIEDIKEDSSSNEAKEDPYFNKFSIRKRIQEYKYLKGKILMY
jgi:hypothetical protein